MHYLKICSKKIISIDQYWKVSLLLPMLKYYHSSNFSRWQRPRYAWRVCIVVYLFVFILTIPTLFVHKIEPYGYWLPPDECESLYPTNYTSIEYTFQV